MRPYSKLALVDAFMHQAQTVPIDSITVKSLVAETEMNPKTFYYHFNGITDMLKWSFERELSALFPDSLVSAGPDWGNDILKIMSYLEKRQSILCQIADSKYWPDMRFFFCQMYERYCALLLKGVIKIVEKTDNIPSNLSDEAFQINVHYYGLLFYSYAEQWVLSGCSVPKEQYFKNCIDVIGEKAMHDAIRRFRTQI